jgi:hypothetical protein
MPRAASLRDESAQNQMWIDRDWATTERKQIVVENMRTLFCIFLRYFFVENRETHFFDAQPEFSLGFVWLKIAIEKLFRNYLGGHDFASIFLSDQPAAIPQHRDRRRPIQRGRIRAAIVQHIVQRAELHELGDDRQLGRSNHACASVCVRTREGQ